MSDDFRGAKMYTCIKNKSEMFNFLMGNTVQLQ